MDRFILSYSYLCLYLYYEGSGIAKLEIGFPFASALSFRYICIKFNQIDI